MKKSILLIVVTAGLFSCNQGSKSKQEIIDIKTSNSVQNIQNDKDIYTKYEYADSKGGSLIIQNSFPKGESYTDPYGREYFKVIFWTRIINETDNPFELKINFPVDSFELPSFPGQFFKILLPQDTMTLDKEPLFNYGLTDLKSFLDNNRNKPSSLNRTINPKESSGFYVVKLTSRPKSGWQGNGAARAEFRLKEKNIFYRIINEGSKSNTILSEIEIRCGSINLEKLRLKK